MCGPLNSETIKRPYLYKSQNINLICFVLIDMYSLTDKNTFLCTIALNIAVTIFRVCYLIISR